MKQLIITYLTVLTSFAGAVAASRTLYHRFAEPLWVCVIVAAVAFCILIITLSLLIQPNIKEEQK